MRFYRVAYVIVVPIPSLYLSRDNVMCNIKRDGDGSDDGVTCCHDVIVMPTQS